MMKKFLFIILVMLVIAGASATGEALVGIDFTSGAYYNTANYLSPDSYFYDDGIFVMLSRIRVGGSLMVGYNLNELMTLGGEVGVLVNAVPFGDSISILADIPLRAYFDLHLGDLLAVTALGGGLLSLTLGESTVTDFAPEAGARVSLIGIYFEAVYVFDETPYQRYGIGYIMPVI